MKMRIIPLEERIVLDAAVVAVVEAVVADAVAEAATLEGDGNVDSSEQGSELEPTLQDVDVKEVAGILSDQEDGLHLLAVSTGIQDYIQLGEAAQTGVEVIYYDAANDSLDDIVTLIDDQLGGRIANTIAFANEGDFGFFSMTDNVMYSLQSITQEAELALFWQRIADHVADDGRIDLLACRVASVMEGQGLITYLEAVTDRNFAASDDLTANTEQNGDWILETDNIDAALLYFDTEELAKWNGVLLHGVDPDCDPDLINIRTGGGSPDSDSKSDPQELVAYNGMVYFAADAGPLRGDAGDELWRSDGTDVEAPPASLQPPMVRVHGVGGLDS